MPITITCTCGTVLRVKDIHAGRRAPCPVCRRMLEIPHPEEESTLYSLSSEEDAPRPRAPEPPSYAEELAKKGRVDPSEEEEEEEEEERPRKPRRRHEAARPTEELPEPLDQPFWHRHLHWLLALAMIPLAISLIRKEPEYDLETRVKETLAKETPEVRARAVAMLASETTTKEELFRLFPEKRLLGAHVAYDSSRHWLYALWSVFFFLSFVMVLGALEKIAVWPIAIAGLFTATIGILLLFLIHILAEIAEHTIPGGRGLGALVFLIFRIIGYSYRAALDPDASFVGSLFGYTMGVGLIEEMCKALPLLWFYRETRKNRWATAFLWGLASGAGFGVAEGIIYSTGMYNGVVGFPIYLVRFFSCVALHGLWAGSVGIAMDQSQDLFHGDGEWKEYGLGLLKVLAVPMVLHGFYDTCLKRDLSAMALATAAVSFAYLAWQFRYLRADDRGRAIKRRLRRWHRAAEDLD